MLYAVSSRLVTLWVMWGLFQVEFTLHGLCSGIFQIGCSLSYVWSLPDWLFFGYMCGLFQILEKNPSNCDHCFISNVLFLKHFLNYSWLIFFLIHQIYVQCTTSYQPILWIMISNLLTKRSKNVKHVGSMAPRKSGFMHPVLSTTTNWV